jgi:hypothetical protein
VVEEGNVKAEDVLEKVIPYFEDTVDYVGEYLKRFDDCTIDSGLNIKLRKIDVWYEPNANLFKLSTNGIKITEFYGDDIKSLTVDKKRFIADSSYFGIFCN